MKNEIMVKNLSELNTFAKNFLVTLYNNERQGATVVALAGDLGAGKTTFVQCVAKELGVTEIITSPTFTIMKSYPINNKQHFSCLVHLDAYRIESMDEIPPLRLEEILTKKENLVFIEWAERIKAVLPPSTIYLDFEIKEEEKRKITISVE